MDRQVVKMIFERKQRQSVMSPEDEVIFEALVAHRDNLIKEDYTPKVRFKLAILNEEIFQMTKHL